METQQTPHLKRKNCEHQHISIQVQKIQVSNQAEIYCQYHSKSET